MEERVSIIVCLVPIRKLSKLKGQTIKVVDVVDIWIKVTNKTEKYHLAK